MKGGGLRVWGGAGTGAVGMKGGGVCGGGRKEGASSRLGACACSVKAGRGCACRMEAGGCRRLPEAAGGCRRLPEDAGGWRLPEAAGGWRLPEAGGCRRLEAAGWRLQHLGKGEGEGGDAHAFCEEAPGLGHSNLLRPGVGTCGEATRPHLHRHTQRLGLVRAVGRNWAPGSRAARGGVTAEKEE
eukprot:364869-Chlamydomonas_euryale.AAC.6